jgi:hypothetical protein
VVAEMRKPMNFKEWILTIIAVLTFTMTVYTFVTDNFVKREVMRLFRPEINIEQNISPEAMRTLRENTPDGEPIRIEKGITIRIEEGDNGEN